MLSLPAPELTRIQQMHIAALFRLRSFIFSCYMDGPALAIVLGCDRAAAAGCTPGLPEVPDAQAGAKKRLRMPEPMPGPGPSKSAEKRDRKSTRLNSSHGYISYAVFCLKKKKQT